MRLRTSVQNARQVSLNVEDLEHRCLLAGDVLVANSELVATADSLGPRAAEVPEVAAPGLQMTLRVVDLQGNEISEVTAGSEFELQLIVQDLRPDARTQGAFAAFADVHYRAEFMELAQDAAASVQHGSSYSVATSVDASVHGLLNELGGVSGSLSGLDGQEHLVASVRLRATDAGTPRFGLDPADNATQHAMLAYGESDVHRHTQYVGTQLTIKTADGQVIPDDQWQPPLDTSLHSPTDDGDRVPCGGRPEVTSSTGQSKLTDVSYEVEPWMEGFAFSRTQEGSRHRQLVDRSMSTYSMTFASLELPAGVIALPPARLFTAESMAGLRSEASDEEEQPWLVPTTSPTDTPMAPQANTEVAQPKPLF